MSKGQNGTALSGLDISLLDAVSRGAGYEVLYEPVAWKQHQLDIAEGRRDIAAGAFFTQERSKFAYYSKPYRNETIVLYVRRGDTNSFAFHDASSMLSMFSKESFRVGAVDGYAYIPQSVNDYIYDPKNTSTVIKSQDVYENLKNLVEGRVDGVLADRIVAATVAQRAKWHDRVEEYPVTLASEPIYFIFSKQTVTPSVVKAFDESIERFRSSEEYSRIMRDYLFPVLLSITVNKPWFFIVEIIGTVAFALSGLLMARRDNYSLFGAFVLAALPAVGGGVVRDLLVDREPIALLRTPTYLLIVMATVLLFFLLDYILHRWGNNVLKRFGETNTGRLVRVYGYEVTDALGLAAFTVIGVVVAIEMRCEPLLLWGPLLAVVTAVGGSIIRDALRADPNSINLKGNFYPEIAIVWGLGFSYFLIWQSDKAEYEAIVAAVIVTMAGVFVTRMTGAIFGWRSPRFEVKNVGG